MSSPVARNQSACPPSPSSISALLAAVVAEIVALAAAAAITEFNYLIITEFFLKTADSGLKDISRIF